MNYVTVKKEEAKAIAQVVSKVSKSSKAWTLYGNTAIDVTSEGLALYCTDLENHFSYGGSPGFPWMVDSKALCGALRVTEDIDIEVIGDKLRVGSSFLPLVENELPSGPSIEVSGNTLLDTDIKALEDITHCISQDITRYNLNTVFFDGSKAIGCDGHRMSVRDISFSLNALVSSFSFYLLNPLKKLEVSTLGVSGDYSYFSGKRFVLASKLVDAQFPDYKQVIPKDSTTQVSDVCPKKLLKVVKAARNTIGDKGKNADKALRVTASDSRVCVFAKNDSCASFSDSFNGVTIDGPDDVFGIKARYLEESAKRFQEPFTLSFSGESQPILMENSEHWELIMPMRFN